MYSTTSRREGSRRNIEIGQQHAEISVPKLVLGFEGVF